MGQDSEHCNYTAVTRYIESPSILLADALFLILFYILNSFGVSTMSNIISTYSLL